MSCRLPGRVVVLVLLAATAVFPARPAHAAGLAGACPDADGVTVVVDFQELGGQALVRCAPGPQQTGLAALKNAGFTITGTARWGEAFICRIEGKPGADTEPCVDTPPASAYWSYWHASNGGTWTYSQVGATGRTPPAGSFEGWSFALDATAGAPPPGAAPRRAPADPAPPDPPPAEPPQPADPGTGDGQGDREEGGAPPGAAARPDPPPASGPAAIAPTGPAGSPSAGPTGTAAGQPGRAPPVPSDVDSTAAARSGAGAPVGVVVGLGLLLALTVAAVVTARRRASG